MRVKERKNNIKIVREVNKSWLSGNIKIKQDEPIKKKKNI